MATGKKTDFRKHLLEMAAIRSKTPEDREWFSGYQAALDGQPRDEDSFTENMHWGYDAGERKLKGADDPGLDRQIRRSKEQARRSEHLRRGFDPESNVRELIKGLSSLADQLEKPIQRTMTTNYAGAELTVRVTEIHSSSLDPDAKDALLLVFGRILEATYNKATKYIAQISEGERPISTIRVKAPLDPIDADDALKQAIFDELGKYLDGKDSAAEENAEQDDMNVQKPKTDTRIRTRKRGEMRGRDFNDS
jgi:hypothetical protein